MTHTIATTCDDNDIIDNNIKYDLRLLPIDFKFSHSWVTS